MSENISKHISYNEAIKSQAAIRLGIKNEPNSIELANMKRLAEKVFEPIRLHFGVPIGISSFYRSAIVNHKIGGSTSSQHCKGQAIDLDADIYGGVTNKEIFYFVKDNLEFDQLIWEFGSNDEPAWVHISFSDNNRGQILRAISEKGSVKYVVF